ncbi:galactose oxidase [Rhizophagus irregularis]|uniref:Galactose oxidase n=1 Tax=Rhizophagus irregularis TaxID=588596 RepID=A0A2N1NEK2_9GLOM|nr:galactose oxidase [Rhizophagus irregularis]
MLKNTLTYFVLLFNLIQCLLTEINGVSPIPAFKPTLRHLHAATVIDDKLYILSGMDDTIGGIVGGTQFFYLNVSAPFNTQMPLYWHDLTSKNIVPPQIGVTAVKGGADNNTLILYGGRNLTSIESKALVYAYDTQGNSWNIPTISGENHIKRRSLTAVVDYQGKVYLFGGKLLGFDSFVNDMITLDTINFRWGKGSSTNAPSSRVNYGATLLPNQNIIYIGGGNSLNESLPLDEVFIYDTNNNNWSTKKTSGLIPSNRYGLTAVLGLDGEQVIVYGGLGNKNIIINPEESLYTLNINTFEWSIPKITGNIPSCRYMHRANVIGNYMVATFGVGYNITEGDVLLLDISDKNEFKWTTTFYPPPPTSAPAPAPPSTPSKNKSVVIGLATGFSLLCAFTVGMFFLYKRNKNRKVKVNTLHIPNSKLDNQSGQKAVETINKVDNHDEEVKQV